MCPNGQPDVTILYGSQTGNAEDMAKRIGKMAKSHGLLTLVEAMDDFPLKELPRQNLVVFICSTTGHGQEPENMKNFYNFIKRRDLPKTCLSKLKYVVYGLGDSSYSKFNYVSKILFKRLKECSAQPIQELVMGDEQHPQGCDGIIYPKLGELWNELVPAKEVKTIESSYIFELLKDGQFLKPQDEFKAEFFLKYNIRTAYCLENKRVTSEDHFQDTRFLRFKADDNLTYEPGDVCAILPANDDKGVQEFLNILDLDPDQTFRVQKRDGSYMINYLYDFIPEGLSVRKLVKYYLDIHSVPKRSFFECLWPFSNDKLERSKLEEFASTEGQEEMYEYCIQPKRSILEVLLDFPNTVKNIRIEYLLDLIPPIKARSFSIASSSRKHPNEFHLIVGVVSFRTRLRAIRKGLCSNYLASLSSSHNAGENKLSGRLRYFIKCSSFKLPKEESVPIIMIGPGLGIAPFRSFIEEQSLKHHSRNRLYFGCRYKNRDFYFQEELNQYSSEGTLELRVAFSREEPKQYVQDLLLKDSAIVKKLVFEEGAIIYVAGNSKLPEDLKRVFVKVLLDTDSEIEAQILVSRLEAQKRIQYDCW